MAKDVQVRKDNKSLNPMDQFSDFDRMVESFFGDRFGSLFNERPMAMRRPLSQVKETEEAYILSAEVPGIPTKDIDIDINGNILTIHAEHKEDQDFKGDRPGYRREYRSFHQSFSLPTTVDPEKIEAHCEDGVLEVLLPKTELAKPKRIEIQTGKGGLMNRLFGKDSDESSKAEKQKH